MGRNTEMMKPTISKSGHKRIDLMLQKGGVVPFPAVGSGWFGLYLVTGGACEVKFGRSKTNAVCLTLENGCVLCVDDSQAARVTQTEPSCVVTALCFKPTFLNVNMAAPSMLCAAYRELADRHGLFNMDAFITHQMQERTLGLIPEEAFVLLQSLDTIGRLLTAEDDWYWSCRIRSHLMDVLSDLEEIRTRRSSFGYDPDSLLFSRMTADIRAGLDKVPSVPEMCARYGVNRNQLQAYFHRFADCSYKEYVQNVRLERAKYCLRFTELSIPEIASRTGYPNTHCFSRFFSEKAGESATDYRTRTVAERKRDFAGCRQRDAK